MRYCPNIPCPHRLRVGSPAEFFDRVARCSDCGTRLVASEEDAIEGRQAVTRDPYRAAAALPDDGMPRAREAVLGGAPLGQVGEAVQGVLLTLGGVLVAAIAYGLTERRSALYLVVLGPLLHRVLSAPKSTRR